MGAFRPGFFLTHPCRLRYTSCMAIRAQLHVKLSAKDAASLKKIARLAQTTVSEAIRHLIRRHRIEIAKAEQ